MLTDKLVARASREDRLEILNALIALGKEADSLEHFGIRGISMKIGKWITPGKVAWLERNGLVSENNNKTGWQITADGLEVVRHGESRAYVLTTMPKGSAK